MITIDLSESTPVVEQVAYSLKASILSGEVRPGQVLPSARQVAGDLGVHWNTVARAYRELADQGFLFVVRGRRAVVRPGSDWADAARLEARENVIRHIRAAVQDAHVAGMTAIELHALLDTEGFVQKGDR